LGKTKVASFHKFVTSVGRIHSRSAFIRTIQILLTTNRRGGTEKALPRPCK
jgi:hypothetical protein